MKLDLSGSSGLVSTSKTSNPLSLKRELILRAWTAIPPYGGGKGETTQMLFFLFFNVFILKRYRKEIIKELFLHGILLVL